MFLNRLVTNLVFKVSTRILQVGHGKVFSHTKHRNDHITVSKKKKKSTCHFICDTAIVSEHSSPIVCYITTVAEEYPNTTLWAKAGGKKMYENLYGH